MGKDDRVRIEVLGPLRVLGADGTDLTPPGALQRRLLALLVLRRGRIVSAEAAIDVLWPSELPRDPTAALQNHLSRLRRGLPPGLIESVGEGYRLDPAHADIDADRLGELVHEGAVLDADQLDEVDRLLERWTDRALPELDDVDDGRVEATRLEELRLRALEAKAEATLDRGDAAAAITELAALAESEPLRERPRSLLMTALARAGRHAEALRVYDDFRRLLADELGIDPSPSLAAQHADLLSGTGVVAWTPSGRLPAVPTSFVGRDELVDDVVDMLSTHRVVTLVGPGGVGKTRAAIEVGRRLQEQQPDRPVLMCELATGDASATIELVRAALGIDARAGVDLMDRMVQTLADTPVVLVLDNCEHVLDPVAEVVERFLADCPNCLVLATSRERLRVPGEAVRPVPVLSWEGDDAPALQLFVERARAVAPDFRPSDDDLVGVAEIARRLDGLPLAIELAAARLHTHDLDEVASALDQRFSLLSAGYRTSPRHGSLSAAVSWSYDLLEPDLQRTFADLSIFAGSFTAADAAAVTGADPRAAEAVLTLLAERSLVMRASRGRYLLLETLRDFGTEQLAAADRRATVAERHARYHVEWAQDADRRMVEPGTTAIEEIDTTLPELRTALTWLLDHGDVEAAGRLIVALHHFGFLRPRPDVLAWAERVVEADVDEQSPLAPHMWAVSSFAAWMAGDLEEAGARTKRAVAASERTYDVMPYIVAVAHGNVEMFQGRLEDALHWYHRAADGAADRAQELISRGTEILARSYADDATSLDLAAGLIAEVEGTVTPYSAYIWHCSGEADLSADVQRARERFTRAIEDAELTRASVITGLAGASRASIDARHGDPQAAAADYRRLIAHWRRAGVWSTQWTMLRSIAVLLERLDRPRDAAVLEGAIRSTTAGHRIFGADEVTLTELGNRIRDQLGEDEYAAAKQEGATLDGDAAVEHALRCL